MVFSDTTNKSGILQQTRGIARLDETQLSTEAVVNSCNNYLDTVAGYAIGADRRFQWDDTNHSKLPVGTTALVSGQSDYSFLTDEQGNTILNLVSISLLEIATNKETKLEAIDIQNDSYNFGSYGVDSGVPSTYDKTADNVIKLDKKPTATEVSKYKLKFYFQRTPSYFTASDTTKAPGVPPLLHRGFVISSAYDAALAFGLDNLQSLSVERQLEERKMIEYFGNRNTDERSALTVRVRNYE